MDKNEEFLYLKYKSNEIKLTLNILWDKIKKL